MGKLHHSIMHDRDKKINDIYYGLADDQKEDLLVRDSEDNDREYHEKFSEKMNRMSDKTINRLHKLYFENE